MHHSLISHHTGATFSTLLDQMNEFMAVVKLIVAIQTANEHAPTFQDWNILLDDDKSTNMHATMFAIGTRGNVGSMGSSLHLSMRD